MEQTTETVILLRLKSGSASLGEIAGAAGISKMAALKHVRQLEERGLVERKTVKAKVGRPYYLFSITDSARSDFRNSDSAVLTALLEYLKVTGNQGIVEDFLKVRYEEYRQRYESEMQQADADTRLRKLVALREKEDYMPELHRISENTYEFLEKNCPIFKMAKNYPVSCSMEQRLFSNVLQMDVDATHRQTDGTGTCRFLIRKRHSVQ